MATDAGANVAGSEAMGWRAVWVLLLAVCLGLGVGLGLVLAVGLCYMGMHVLSSMFQGAKLS